MVNKNEAKKNLKVNSFVDIIYHRKKLQIVLHENTKQKINKNILQQNCKFKF